MSMILMALAMAATASPDAVVGRWKTETRNGIVEITRCGASLCGKILGSDGLTANPALKDTNNKDEKLRGRALKGLQILGGFSFEDGVWDKGTIYNAEDGKTYGARITPVDANTLKLRGCIFVPLCKNQTWTRVR
ncbi:DUF2147 domain-containing protein [Rhizorhabdus wittichii]|uniref:DUF2147 domain-containing protein n=2 Tax=Rhizorhabdus wittichii TaxID=160791 RepID=A0A9J9HEF9_RHIWR|nr:DUF2147 domain-containing protein [Rhizorhabdus wittichii]ABQ70139.1 Uncharacterized protein Swit_3794 [Rhizorhabdus wittichii RW1]ARR52900.1 hypothetical protein HY78_05275 [Rhizorhabdus wittichii DC-6]QTH24569.1 DUF2147 domain-containing protein [Rhizorhabdus wittichii]